MDYYSILGVSKTASQEEIKKAYRKLASVNHPDKGGDTKKFQDIQVAYDTLGDPQKRQQYDNMSSRAGQNPFGNFNNPGFSFNAGPNLDEIFNQMFRQQSRKFSQTYKTVVWITLEQVYNGATQTLNINIDNQPYSFTVEIPKGCQDGQNVRLDNILNNASLVIEFRIQPNKKYERNGANLISTYDISILDLIVGTSFMFETISKKTLEIKVHPKTQPNSQLKISGHGLPINNTYGDQIIILRPFLPEYIPEAVTQAILDSQKI